MIMNKERLREMGPCNKCRKEKYCRKSCSKLKKYILMVTKLYFIEKIGRVNEEKNEI